MQKNKHYKLTDISFELTKNCNERCPHCYIPKQERGTKDYMPTINAKKILNQAAQIGVKVVIFTGGEPFLHKKILDIVLYAYKLNFENIYILSNLTLLDEKDIDILMKLENLTIQTTLFSTESLIHDKLTGLIGSHDKTVTTLKKLKKRGVKVKVSCPILRQNYSTFRDLQKWADINKYAFYPNFDIVAQTNYSTSNQTTILSNVEKVALIKDLIIIDKHPFWSKWKDLIDDKKVLNLFDNPCEAGINQIVIAPNGNVHPCILWQKSNIGNLNKTKLGAIWHNSEVLNEIRNTKYKDFNLNENINPLKYIRVCYARNANSNNGDFLHISDEDFNYAFLLKNMIIDLNNC